MCLFELGELQLLPFFFGVCGFNCVLILRCSCGVIFAPPCLLLIAEDRQDSSDRWYLHAEVCLIDDCLELNDGVVTEDNIVWVGDVYHIKGYELCSLGVAFAKGHIQIYFAEGFDSFSPKANKWVLGVLQVLFCEPHLQEALPGEDIRGAVVVEEDPTNVVSHEVHGISSNVSSMTRESLCG